VRNEANGVSDLFQRCAIAHRLQGRVTRTDTSHSGEQVTISADGAPYLVTISGNPAQISINDAARLANTRLSSPVRPLAFPRF